MLQLPCGEGGGGAAAYIECTSPEPGTCQHSAHPLNFPDQSLEVGLHHSTGAGGGRADKAAVGAAGGAKGNSHIEGNIPGPQQLSRLDCSLGGLQAQLPPGGRDVVNLLQHSPGSPEGPSLHQELGGNLRRAHAGQGPPGGRLRQQRTGGSVIASLQQAPPQLHPPPGREWTLPHRLGRGHTLAPSAPRETGTAGAALWHSVLHVRSEAAS